MRPVTAHVYTIDCDHYLVISNFSNTVLLSVIARPRDASALPFITLYFRLWFPFAGASRPRRFPSSVDRRLQRKSYLHRTSLSVDSRLSISRLPANWHRCGRNLLERICCILYSKNYIARPDRETTQPMGAGSRTRRPQSAAAATGLESTLAEKAGNYNRRANVTLTMMVNVVNKITFQSNTRTTHEHAFLLL